MRIYEFKPFKILPTFKCSIESDLEADLNLPEEKRPKDSDPSAYAGKSPRQYILLDDSDEENEEDEEMADDDTDYSSIPNPVFCKWNVAIIFEYISY